MVLLFFHFTLMKTKKILGNILLVLLLIILQSCNKFFSPDISNLEVPSGWKGELVTLAEPKSPISDRFWEVFNDLVLNNLEEQGIKHNLDLEAAFYRIEQARALTSIEDSNLFPRIDFNASVTRDEALIDPGELWCP